MTPLIDIIIKIYAQLLRLYPRQFREEFSDEMLSDFLEMAEDASRKGSFALVVICLRELIDFPLNLLRVHFEEGRMFRVLRSQPINYGFRNALVFGMGFGLAGLIPQLVFLSLVTPDNSVFGWLQVAYSDLFHTAYGFEFINWFPSALSSILTGSVIGIAFAALFAERTKQIKYALVFMMCWFLHSEIFAVSFYATDLQFFLGTKPVLVLSWVSSISSGAFLGLMFYVSKSENRLPLRLLSIGCLAYPVVAYIYMQLLLKFSIIEMPWMFVALMILLVAYIGSVIGIAIISESAIRVPWLLIFSALLPLLVRPITQWVIYLVSLLLGPANFPYQMPLNSPQFWPLIFRMAVDHAIYGVLIGLVMGVLFGLLNKRNPQLVTEVV